ncbi:polymer-forming cytoskeletal protein [bacterium]|nr:polymer-forming cytoskeletal protein [bacterium]
MIGETAQVTADINARNISIAGTVYGNVSGRKVQLLRTARVMGDISAATLATEEGAFIDGKITMREAASTGIEAPSLIDEIAITVNETSDAGAPDERGEQNHDLWDSGQATAGNGAPEPETRHGSQDD